MTNFKQIAGTVAGILSIFVIGLLFRQLLVLTSSGDNTQKSVVQLAKGISETEKGNHKQSIEFYQNAINLDTTNVTACNCLGRAYYHLKQYGEAIEVLSKIPNPGHISLQYRADAYFAADNYSNAFIDYTESIKQFPTAESYVGLASVLMKVNNLKESIVNYTKAIEMAPDSANYYFYRGKVHNLQGSYDNALADFDKAIELSPENIEYTSNKEFAAQLKKMGSIE